MLKIDKITLALIFLFFTVNIFAQVPEEVEVVEEEPVFSDMSIEEEPRMEDGSINVSKKFTPPAVIPKKVRRRKNRGRYGFYGSGVTVIPFVYDQLPEKFSDFMIAKKGNKYGVINKRNEAVIPFIYENMYVMYDDYKTKKIADYVKVESKKLFGLINRKGEIIIPVKYKNLEKWGKQNFLAGTVDNEYGILSTSGKVIHPFTFEQKPKFAFDSHHIIKIGGKEGVCDNFGKIVIPIQYDYIGTTLYSRTYLMATQNKKHGLIDHTGKQVLPMIYDNIKEKKDKTWVVTKDKKQGVLKSDFREMVPIIFDRIEKRNDFYFLVRNGYRYGIVDLKGKEVLPCEYQKLLLTGGDVFIGRKEGTREYFVIDKTGKRVLEQGFISAYSLGGTNFFKVKNDLEKYALFNAGTKKLVTAFEYDDFFSKRKKGGYKIGFKKDGNKGVLSETGEELESIPQKNTSSYKSNQKIVNSKATIKKNIVGTWEGLLKVGEKEYWHELIFEKGGERGQRRIYYQDKEQSCVLMQNFVIVIIGGGYQPYQVVLKTNTLPISSCGVLPDYLAKNTNQFQQEWLNTVRGQLDPLMIKEVTKKTKSGIVKFAEVEKKIRFAKISKDLKSKLISKPGGDSNAEFSIDPTTLEVSIVSFGTNYPIGKIELKKEDYVFSTTQWEATGHYALSGTLKNIKYIDRKGKVKTGDLDLCFKGSTSQRYWFKEFKD